MADEGVPVTAPEGSTILVDRAGNRFAIPDENVQAALADPVRAFRAETPQETAAHVSEAKYGDREVAAGAAGLARGLSVGLSDVALTKTGLVAPETLKGLKEANPVTSTATEVAGTAAGLLLPGLGEANAVRGVAEAGNLAARGVEAVAGAGRLANATGAVARGVTEGGLYGLGNVLSEDALGDTQLTADKLAASVGLGALLGGGGSALAEAIGAAAKPVLRKGAEAAADALEALPGQVQSAAEGRALKAAGFSKATLKGLGNSEEDILGAGRTLLDSGVISPGDTSAEVLQKVQGKLKETGKAIGTALEGVDAKGHRFDFSRFAQKAYDEVLQPLENDPARKAEAKALGDLLADYSAKGETTFTEANRLKGGLGTKIRNWDPLDPIQRERRQVFGILNGEIERQVGDAGGAELRQAFRQDKELYGVLLKSNKAGEADVRAELGNRFFSPSDQGLGVGAALMHGGPLGVAAGMATAAANKIARERLPSALAVGLDALAKHPAFEQLAGAFSGFAKRLGEASPAVLGEYAPLLANAVARGPTDALLTHAVLSERDPKYRDTMAQAGLDYSEPAAAVSQKAQALAIMKAHLSAHDADVEAAIKAALAKKAAAQPMGLMRSGLLGDAARGPLKDFATRTAELQRLAANPAELADRVASALGPVADTTPSVAAALTATASRAVGFLADRAPRPDDPLADIPALKSDWQPSEAERRKFERYVAAVSNPTAIFEDLAHGRVTKEAVEALQSVYPQMHEQLKASVLDQLSRTPNTLDYRQRLAWGELLGMPLTPSARPERLLALQMSHHAAAPQQPAPKGPPPIKPINEATAAQRSEARGTAAG
jgi:hypothetical protein